MDRCAFYWTPILRLSSEHWCVHYTANMLALLFETQYSIHIRSCIKTMSEPSLLTDRQSSQSKMYTAAVVSLNLHHHMHACTYMSPTGNVAVHRCMCCMHTHTQPFDSDACMAIFSCQTGIDVADGGIDSGRLLIVRATQRAHLYWLRT